MKFIISSVITFFLGFSVIAQNTIIDHLGQDEKFSIILELLEITELEHLLTSNDYYTLIAPDNDAFLHHYTLAQLDSLKQDGIEELTNLMEHHIIPGYVDIDDLNKLNIPLYGEPIWSFIDANGIYRIGSSSFSDTKMYMDVDVENGRVLESFCSILVNRNESIRENFNLLNYWYHFFAENTIGLEEDLDIIDTIINSENDLTIIGLFNSGVVGAYIQENGGPDKELFADSLIRRHVISGFYTLQNIYDGLIVKNWLGEDVLFTVVDDKYFVNHKEIYSQSIFTDAAVFQLVFPDDIIEPLVISTIEENLILTPKFFPNPVHQELNVEINGDHIISDFEMYNLQGELVFYEREIRVQKIIDVNNFMPGMYVIRYEQNGVYYSKKFLKN